MQTSLVGKIKASEHQQGKQLTTAASKIQEASQSPVPHLHTSRSPVRSHVRETKQSNAKTLSNFKLKQATWEHTHSTSVPFDVYTLFLHH
jgi:hypothetical protein